MSEADQRPTVTTDSPIALQRHLSDSSAGRVSSHEDGTEALRQSEVDLVSEGTLRSLVAASAEQTHGGFYRCESKDDDIQFAVEVKGDFKLLRSFLHFSAWPTNRRAAGERPLLVITSTTELKQKKKVRVAVELQMLWLLMIEVTPCITSFNGTCLCAFSMCVLVLSVISLSVNTNCCNLLALPTTHKYLFDFCTSLQQCFFCCCV